MENLSPEITTRLRVAQLVTLALLVLVALAGHRVEMQHSAPAPITLH